MALKSFKQWLNESTNVLYHGTSSARIPSIKQTGLEPRAEKRTVTALDRNPHVYGTKNPGTAEMVAHHTVNGWNDFEHPTEGDKGAHPMLLAIKRSAFKGARRDPEFESSMRRKSANSFYVDHKITPENVHVIRNKHVPKIKTAFYGKSLKQDKYISPQAIQNHQHLTSHGWQVQRILHNGAEYSHPAKKGHSIQIHEKPAFLTDPSFVHYNHPKNGFSQIKSSDLPSFLNDLHSKKS